MVWQTLFLDFYCIAWLGYFISRGYRVVRNENEIQWYLTEPPFWENAFATIGNAFLICHDWLFTE